MSATGDFVKSMREQSKKTQSAPVQIGQILTLNPLSIQYQGLDLSLANGDTIYINGLILDANINLDVASMDSAQNLASVSPPPWTANNKPTDSYTAEISGTQKQFLTDFYNWTKSVHDRFILHIGDYVAIQKLGNNTYLVLEKVQKLSEGES